MENLAGIFDAGDKLPCFHKQEVPVSEIQQWQLIDDPDDIDGIAKVESFRGLLRSGSAPPAIVLVHTPGAPVPASGNSAHYVGAYHLLEGRHRYNAAYQERLRAIFAWVAHVGCCGGPEGDLREEPSAW